MRWESRLPARQGKGTVQGLRWKPSVSAWPSQGPMQGVRRPRKEGAPQAQADSRRTTAHDDQHRHTSRRRPAIAAASRRHAGNGTSPLSPCGDLLPPTSLVCKHEHAIAAMALPPPLSGIRPLHLLTCSPLDVTARVLLSRRRRPALLPASLTPRPPSRNHRKRRLPLHLLFRSSRPVPRPPRTVYLLPVRRRPRRLHPAPPPRRPPLCPNQVASIHAKKRALRSQ
jgi:hypothetical protein